MTVLAMPTMVDTPLPCQVNSEKGPDALHYTLDLRPSNDSHERQSISSLSVQS